MREAVHTGTRLAALALAWVAGVALHLQQRDLWSDAAYMAAVGGGVLLLLAAWRWPRAFVTGLLGIALLAFAGSGMRASQRLADALPAALDGEDMRVVGVITSLPQRSAAGVRFRFEPESASFKGHDVRLPQLLSVGWYKGMHEDAVANTPQEELRAGQRWRFTLRLRRPHGNLNPGGFDYELSLFEQGVRATGAVRDGVPSRAADLRDAGQPELLHRAAGYPVERLRQRVRDAIFAAVPDPRTAGVLAALAVGDQGAIDRADWDLYRNTGVAHLVSISGLHITMFAWLAGTLIAAAWRRSARAVLWCAAPIAARWGGLACATSYAVFSGWGVPSQRTIWMLATVTMLQTLGLRWPWPLILLLAAVVVTAIDPWALMQPGFWLSFMAVALLMASSTRDLAATSSTAADDRGRIRRWAAAAWGAMRRDLRTQVIATIGLAPLTLVFFQQLSVVGFAANLIAIPLITLVITPLALLGVFVVPLWTFGAWCVQWLDIILGGLAAVPGAVWTAPVAPLWAQLAGLLGAALLVLPLPWRARALAAPLLVGLVLPPLERPPTGEFELLALDVGQGTSVVVRTHDHLLVFDAGPQYSRDSDAGQRVLLPLLRARGESSIDRLVLSHRDLDHVGGAPAILKAMPVSDVLSSLELDHPLLTLATHATRCSAGQSWEWDGVHFDVLRPEPADYDKSLKSNAMSCVLHVSSGGANSRSALLTGDIEREQETALVAAAAQSLRSEVLIVPHHGSRTSSTAAFLDAVQPRVAVFQAGYRNRFGHPAPDVVERYLERGIETHVSPDCGAWRWDAHAAPQGACWRDVAHRYWQHAGRSVESLTPDSAPRAGEHDAPERL